MQSVLIHVTPNLPSVRHESLTTYAYTLIVWWVVLKAGEMISMTKITEKGQRIAQTFT